MKERRNAQNGVKIRVEYSSSSLIESRHKLNAVAFVLISLQLYCLPFNVLNSIEFVIFFLLRDTLDTIENL